MSEKLSEAIIDFANAIEAACIQLKRYVADVHGVTAPARWSPDKIKWTSAEGAKSPFEMYPAKDQKAEATQDYKNMLADIKQHGGKLMRNGYFMWIFQDGATVGRKRKGKGQGETKQEPSSSMRAVRAKFPQELEELLNFSVEGNDVVIKPRRFLGSENFSKIAAIVRESNGEYISAGKDSHFRVPVK